jgi:RNA polymerase sigma factor (sigma-70 family)
VFGTSGFELTGRLAARLAADSRKSQLLTFQGNLASRHRLLTHLLKTARRPHTNDVKLGKRARSQVLLHVRSAQIRPAFRDFGGVLPSFRYSVTVSSPAHPGHVSAGTLSQTHISLLGRLADSQAGPAWSEFLDRYGDLIRGFCLRRGLQPADCEDVTQDVLLSLSKSMPQFQYDPAKGLFRSYLKTVVMNAISRRIRQNPAAVRLLESAAGPSADGGSGWVASEEPEDESRWEDEWRQYHFRRAMRIVESEFKDSDRAAFKKYAIEGLDVKSVAAEVGISVDAVYQAKSRIVRRLGQLIELQVAEEG